MDTRMALDEWERREPAKNQREWSRRLRGLSITSADGLPLEWDIYRYNDDGVYVQIKVNEGTSYSSTCARDAKRFRLEGRAAYWAARAIAQRVMEMKDPIRQARCLIRAGAGLESASKHPDIALEARRDKRALVDLLTKAVGLWAELIDERARRRLGWAKTNDARLIACKRGLADLRALRSALDDPEAACMTREGFCFVPVADRIREWHERISALEAGWPSAQSVKSADSTP